MFSRSRKEPDVKNKRLRNYRAVKRAFDMAGSVLLMAVSAPAVLTAAAAIKAETPGNVIFVHNRIGENGKKIRVYKFRSMHSGAENLEASLNDDQLEAFYREYKLKDDPRVTEIGHKLRKSSLDELPQLLNVICGSMSLVGPRPVMKGELDFYDEDEQKLFLSVKPGLTGYWQVYARNDATYQSGMRQQMELYYAQNESLLLDLKILAATPLAVIRKKGAY
jgi:lipopolysaccharide/colanic/teichoic acid biosynthesis glycosyltransferase